MASIRIRVSHPDGQATLTLSATSTVADLRHEITAATSLSAFELKSGFPPRPLDLDQFAPDVLLTDTGLSLNGEQLRAVKKDLAHALSQPLGSNAPPSAPSIPSHHSASTPPQSASTPSTTTAPRRPRPRRTAKDVASDPPEIAIPSHNATLVLRVMPDDNSCLFRALSAAALGTGTTSTESDEPAGADSMPELRSLVASTITAQPEVYTAAILDKDPAAYCAWIRSPASWGGAIELGILAQHFALEVCSINVQDGRVDRFNEGASSRIVLVYSGIHYDVVALSPSEAPHEHADLPAEFDTRVFDAADAVVLEAARALCMELQSAHYFTDTAGFGVVCNVSGCGWRGKGEKEAVQHAKATGHYDFGEA